MSANKADKGQRMRTPSILPAHIRAIIATGKDASIKPNQRLRLYDLQFELDISAHERLVWGAISKHVRSSLGCRLLQDTLCRETSLSKASINRAIGKLRNRKLLTVISRGNVHGERGRSSSLFILHPPDRIESRSENQIRDTGRLESHSENQIVERNSETADNYNKLSPTMDTDRLGVFDSHRETENLEPIFSKADLTCPKCKTRTLKIDQAPAGEYRYCDPLCGFSQVVSNTR